MLASAFGFIRSRTNFYDMLRKGDAAAKRHFLDANNHWPSFPAEFEYSCPRVTAWRPSIRELLSFPAVITQVAHFKLMALFSSPGNATAASVAK